MAQESSGPARLGGMSGLALAIGGIVVSAGSSLLAQPQPQPVAAIAKPSDFANACRPEFLQQAASRASTKITIGEVTNGPRLPGGASYVPAGAAGPAYCQVSGTYVTNAATGKTANFMATFPENWNGKYLQFGCFGHCGFFALNIATVPLSAMNGRDILAKGYASFGTDQGHIGRGAGSWAIKAPGQLDQDAFDDFLYRANEVLAHAGKEFTAAFYGSVSNRPVSVARSYFTGCSGGGRDALVAASRFPQEFDGIIAGSPYADMMGTAFQNGGASLSAIRAPDADLSPALLSRFDAAVKAKCDGTDGVTDGLIQNPAACNVRPERDLPLCTPGPAAGECFTRAQIETISTLITAVTDETGRVVQPGFTVSELQYAARMPTPADPAAADPWLGDEFNRYGNSLWPLVKADLEAFVHRGDPSFHARSVIAFREGGRGAIKDFRTVVPQSEVRLARNAVRNGLGGIPEDASALINGNRKLLIWSNLSDEKLTPYMAINYYKRLARLHGGYANLKNNVRLFALPGTFHCNLGGIGPMQFDPLSAMENWVEKGEAPDSLPAAMFKEQVLTIDPTARPERTMPLCAFPAIARYRGIGDVKDGANWSCPVGDTSMLRIGESGRRAGVLQ